MKRVSVNASTWKMRKGVSAAYRASFARIRASGYTYVNRRGGPERPEMREIEFSIDLRTR